MPLQATSGAASYDAFGGGVPAAPPTYIEDVFSTWLYTGNGSTQTITNGIDLAGKGGLVWLKNRTGGSGPHNWYTTNIGSASYLDSSQTSGLATYQEALSTYNSNGFSLSSGAAGGNENTFTYASWTFRKQPKFFDVVTYTGNGTASRAISHSLGSAPAMIIVKQTDDVRNWPIYHRSVPNGTGYLNTTAAINNSAGQSVWGDSSYNNIPPTSTVFYVGNDFDVNKNGGTYIAYIFAHDAGGFGLTGTDNVISCGSFTTDGSGAASVNLGYEPQWVMQKRIDSSTGGNWYIADNMRGMNVNGSRGLFPNLSDSEETTDQGVARINATGFTASRFANATYIYIAIRRGPMKVPTTGTSVFNPIVRNGTAANATVTGVGFPVDLAFTSRRAASHLPVLSDRLRGAQRTLSSSGTYEEQTETIALTSFASMDGVSFGADNTGYFNGFNNANGASYVNWFFKRAPSVFDIVCWTGSGSAMTVSHNLQAVPELMIVKRRNSATYGEWFVYTATLGNAKYQLLNTTQASTTANSGIWNLTTPTSTVMSVGSDLSFSASPYVAYLFATCAGVSKVGSYTGTGTTKQIDCGFTAGARFVLIKRTDSTGNWYVWDTARGIISGDDPYLLINTEDAEVTNTDYIDPYSAGFEISSTAPAAINASGGTFIFLAIA